MAQSPTWEFDLYVAGTTPKAQLVYANLQKFCKEHLKNYKIIVYDLLSKPELAVNNQITATPTTIRRSPLPPQVLIGDLSDTEKIILKLNLK